MPHTASRFQQDLSFIDGLYFFSPNEISAISASGTAPTLTRNAVGDIAWNLPASSGAYFDINIMNTILRRSGYFEDIQEQFGSTFGSGLGGVMANPPNSAGTGIPGSAAPQGRPDGYILPGQPQPASGMAALQEITPRTALKLKGFKPKSINAIYKVLTGAMTTLTVSLTQTIFTNGNTVASGQTTLLAAALNGLVNVAQANPYVTNVPLTAAIYYNITPNTELWLEFNVVSPAGNSFQLYGVEVLCDFNFN